MTEPDKKIFEQLDGQHKGLYILLRNHIDAKFEGLNSTVASMQALIITLTNNETFQKIISDELDKQADSSGDRLRDREI